MKKRTTQADQQKGVRYERRKLSEIVPDEHNPRTISKARRSALGGSLRKFGQVEPLIFNELTGRLVGGHQRLDLLRELGETEADVAIGSWSEDEERVLNVILNSPEAQGEFTNVKAYLDGALRSLSLGDFAELRLDALVLEPQHKQKGRYAESMTEVEPVNTSAIKAAGFEMVISGDIATQDRVLAALKTALAGLEVQIRVGLTQNKSR